jgi:hypothetical protein
MGCLAAQTSRTRLGTAVVTVPFYGPIRVLENIAFVDIRRVAIGPASIPCKTLHFTPDFPHLGKTCGQYG